MERAPARSVDGVRSEAVPQVEPDRSPGLEPGLKIADVAARTGLSKDTLRYYEKAGLIEAVDRSVGGQRRYAATDLAWLEFLLRLRVTGMPIATMRRFAELRRDGDSTIADRLTLLEEHRDTVERHVADLQLHLARLIEKIDLYEGMLHQRAGTDTP